MQGEWAGASRPTIADEQGNSMDRGGEEALREMSRQANELLVEQLGRQMNELFTGLTQKQEEDNRRLREENIAIRKQMLELEREKLGQNNRMEQLMAALLRQMGGDQSLPRQAVSAEMTPERSSRPEAVIEQAATFRRTTEENAPSTQQKQVRPGVVAQQWLPARHPGEAQQAADASGSEGQLSHPGVEVAGIDIAELVRKSQVMEEALRDVMTTGQGVAAFTGYLQARGHKEVVGMIESGGVSLSATI